MRSSAGPEAGGRATPRREGHFLRRFCRISGAMSERARSAERSAHFAAGAVVRRRRHKQHLWAGAADRPEPRGIGRVPSRMRILARGLPWIALLLLGACGVGGEQARSPGPTADGATTVSGAPRTGDTTLFRVEPPARGDAMAAAVTPDGRIVVKRGGNERGYPFEATAIRIVAEASQPWSLVTRALERSTVRGTPQVTIVVVDRGAVVRTVVFDTHVGRVSNAHDDVVLRYRFREGNGEKTLVAVCRGPLWRVTYGCEGSQDRTWPWVPGRVPGGALYLLDTAQRFAESRAVELRVVVEAEAAEATTRATIDEVTCLLAESIRAGIETVDLGLDTFSDPRRIDVGGRGLQFLAAHQAEGGAWEPHRWEAVCDGRPMPTTVESAGDAAFQVGVTGLVLHAFLSAGYTNRGKHPYARVVARGARYLKKAQQPSGRFAPPGSRWSSLNHALATLAMTQLYAMTESPIFKGSAHAAQTCLGEAWREDAEDALTTGITVLAILSERLLMEDRARRGKPPLWRLPRRAALSAEVVDACHRLTASHAPRDMAVGCAGALLLDDNVDARHVAARLRELLVLMRNDRLADPAAGYFGLLGAHRVGGATGTGWRALHGDALRLAQREGEPCCGGGSWAAGAASPGHALESTAFHVLSSVIRSSPVKVIGRR